MVRPSRFEIHLVALDPAVGAEMQKTRPCVVVSPDESNHRIRTVVIVPLTSEPKGFPGRIRLRFQNRDGEVGIDQLRAVDKSRLLRRIGTVKGDDARRISDALVDFFSF
ncbi:MAG: type II toxin-antitoxin system PemK/MazF family toxin [Rhizomicrobium sp.]